MIRALPASMGYRPALDGLRGVAVLLVIASHAGLPGFGFAGQVGVTMFFVLSGFLITALLLEEHEREGRISLPAFYWRRALRLLPALIIVIVCVGIVSRDWAAPLWTMSYVGNWARVVGADLGPLNHTWSLAIEEQFYILWPVALIALQPGVRTLLVAAGLSAFLRIAIGDEARVFLGTDTRADALLIGCALAMSPWRRVQGWTAVGAMGGLVVLGLIPSYTWLTLAAPLTAVLILYGLHGSRLLSLRPLRWTGRVSYGLYLWHFPLLLVLPWWLAIPATFAVATASFYGVEHWFLQLKRPRSAGTRTMTGAQAALTR